MAAIHADISALSQASAGWFSDAPPDGGTPPFATPLVDPISAAAMTVVADWPAVHEALVAVRATNAAKLITANSGTATILSTTDISNAALIMNKD